MTHSREQIVEMLAAEWDQVFDDPIEAARETLTVIERAGYKIVSGEPVAWISPLELQKLKAYGSAIVTPTFKNGLNGHTPLYRGSEPQR